MTVQELARCQGFQPGDLSSKAWKKLKMSARGSMVGNSMSVPVLTEAIRTVLLRAGVGVLPD